MLLVLLAEKRQIKSPIRILFCLAIYECCMLPAAINWPSSWSNAFSALLMKLTETHVVLQWSYLGIYQMQQYPLCYQQATQKSSWALIRSWLAFITKNPTPFTNTHNLQRFQLFFKRLLWNTCTEGSTYLFLLLFQPPIFDTMIIRFSRNTFLFFITTDKSMSWER